MFRRRNLLVPLLSSFGAGFGLATFMSYKNETFKPVLAATSVHNPPSIIQDIVPYKGGVALTDDMAVMNMSRSREIMKHGYPSLDNLRVFDNYVLSYDRRNRVANWVFEHMTFEKLRPAEDIDRGKSEFKEDPFINPYFRSTNQDYKGSGYDRGHMAAAANHRSNQKLMDQTFFLSNMAPQVGQGFNRDKWNDLEKEVRGLVKKHDNVWVCTGPLYLPK